MAADSKDPRKAGADRRRHRGGLDPEGIEHLTTVRSKARGGRPVTGGPNIEAVRGRKGGRSGSVRK